MRDTSLPLVGYGVGVGVGLLLMGYAVEAYHWLNYMRANPAVGTVSSSGEPMLAVLFVAGATVAFVAFASGLRRATRPDVES
jgi:hypothetical protein